MANLMRRQFQPFYLGDLQDEINRLLDMSLSTRNKNLTEEGSDFVPAIDVKDEKDHYLIRADIPGVDPKDIEVTLNNSVLTIRGEKESESKEKKEGFVRIERTRGSFYRQIALPETVDDESIAAKCKNGVLEILVPKTKKNGSRKINISVEK